jgi:Domain of unknown function (DUF4402)
VRKSFSILILLLLFLAQPSYAGGLQGGTSGEVRVTSEVIDINYLKMTSLQDMRMPQVYTNYASPVNSEDGTAPVVGGKTGQNAIFSITGRPGTAYDINFATTGLLNDANGHQMYIHYNFSVKAGGMISNDENGNGVRLLDSNGNDTLSIMGSIEFDGSQKVGAYDNLSAPLVVTIAFDEAQSKKIGGLHE